MARGYRAKLSVTVDPNLYQTIIRHAEKAKASKTRLARLAKEGYQKMACEDTTDAEAYLSAMSEILQ